ncbi:hypothetical protein UA08_00519 [Talaromyces atroroseus]|uniref:Cupin type-1 domain-containing protein n=1 Tax=Talaromyces atroroseus TaxID=1441469 RepID=A0A225BBC9_TALAT|nr:hypothetical protein UA08_00519 [Talaromyces atroroseus]OKL64215.1 hypothetical protein UA08_00519 [Talaromyces atroroseus]
MHVFALCLLGLASAAVIQKRDDFGDGEPIDEATGKGASILGTNQDLGGTNHQLDLQNPANLGQQSTDAGYVPNLKWSFSDSKTDIYPGGWMREQVVSDMPQSTDIAGAQQHLQKGAIRELHWHRTAEWGYLYNGSILLSAVDEQGRYQIDTLVAGDAWYFPAGIAHTIQGLDDENEYLLAFDDADFEAQGTTFMVDDWVVHTPRDILAQNLGVHASVFDSVPPVYPYILNGTVSADTNDTSTRVGNSSFVYHAQDHPLENIAGSGGTYRRIDSSTFPVATTLAAGIFSLEPKTLREMHWHPNGQEWLYFQKGTAQATVFIGGQKARTYDFQAGDVGVFPVNSGHYIKNTSEDEELIWVSIFKSDKVEDISLTQWLALTPHDVVATVLNIPVSVVDQLKTQKQVLISG